MWKVFSLIFGIFDFFLNLAKMKENWKNAGVGRKIFYVLTGLLVGGLAVGGTYLTLHLFLGNFSGWEILVAKIGAAIVGIITVPLIIQAFFGLLFNTIIIFAGATQNVDRKTSKGFDVAMGFLNLIIFAGYIAFEILIFYKFFA